MDRTEIVGVLLIIIFAFATIFIAYKFYRFIEEQKEIVIKSHHLINRLKVMNKSLHNNVPEMVEKLKEIDKNK